MKISENYIKDFISVLASKEPVPGGGGAAALCGAVGTALGNMVGSLTVGKKKYVNLEEEIITMKSSCDRLQEDFLSLIDADAEAFYPLSQAYGLPSDTEDEKVYKEEILEQRSKDACEVPLLIMEKCCEAIDLIGRFAQIGSRLAVSDAACAAAITRGALQAASLNIYINTKGLQDREFAENINERANQMLGDYCKRAEDIFTAVYNSLQ